MNRLFFCLVLALLSTAASAQFQIGQTTITFNDPERSGGVGNGGGPGRQIETEIYYPAATAGVGVDVAAGSFPVVVIGHGFLMTFDAYANMWQTLVPAGYIVALPKTEGTFTPSHSDFGLDLALVANRVRALNTDVSSLFNEHVTPQAALIGHSMGGGAAVLAAQVGDFDAYVGFASAETNPSAVGAASNIFVPMLMFAGDGDAVTPPADHQVPIYNAATSSCKALVTIEGGGHCFFANASATCDVGELFAGSTITLTREEQQAIVNLHMLPWLAFWLKGEAAAFADFESLLEASTDVNFELDCAAPVSVATVYDAHEIKLFPNPGVRELRVQGLLEPAVFQVFRPDGRMVAAGQFRADSPVLDIATWPVGYYILRIETSSGVDVLRFMKGSED
jgi:dienelactone hydrolase